MFTTEQVIVLLAESCRQTATSLTGKKKTYGARVLFDQVILTLKQRDPDTATILRRLAMERLRVVSGEDPEAAKLINDPGDPFHLSFLMVTPDFNLMIYIAQKKKGGQPNIAEAFANMMNR